MLHSKFASLLFHEVINVSLHGETDWGLDFWWCGLAESRFGYPGCIETPYISVKNFDTRSLTDGNKLRDHASASANDYYKKLMKEKFNLDPIWWWSSWRTKQYYRCPSDIPNVTMSRDGKGWEEIVKQDINPGAEEIAVAINSHYARLTGHSLSERS